MMFLALRKREREIIHHHIYSHPEVLVGFDKKK